MNANHQHQNENQHAAGKVYIVTENPCTLIGSEDLKIMQVRPELEAAFQKEYAGRIIASGSSIQDVLIRFSELINGHSQ